MALKELIETIAKALVDDPDAVRSPRSKASTTCSSSCASPRKTSARSSEGKAARPSRCGRSSRPCRPSSGVARTSTSSTEPNGSCAGRTVGPLAEVARPHGVWGEVRLKLFNSDSELLLLAGTRCSFGCPSSEEHEVWSSRPRAPTTGYLLAKFRWVDDRDAAERLRGAAICIDATAFRRSTTGSSTCATSIGATLVGPGGDVGIVQDFVSYPSAEVLVVDAEWREGRAPVEMPLIDDFIERVDAGAGESMLEAARPPARAEGGSEVATCGSTSSRCFPSSSSPSSQTSFVGRAIGRRRSSRALAEPARVRPRQAPQRRRHAVRRRHGHGDARRLPRRCMESLDADAQARLRARTGCS